MLPTSIPTEAKKLLNTENLFGSYAKREGLNMNGNIVYINQSIEVNEHIYLKNRICLKFFMEQIKIFSNNKKYDKAYLLNFNSLNIICKQIV